MPMYEHKLLSIVGAGNGHDWYLLHKPALQQVRADAGLTTHGGKSEQLLAIGIAHRNHRNARLARRILQIRTAPDRRARAPVDIYSRVHGDQSRTAPFLDQADQRRIAEAQHDYDVATDQPLHLGDRSYATAE